MDLTIKPSSKHKIRFIDCDPLGHLTNSRYLDYMLNAREDHVIEHYNLDYFIHSKQTGCSWIAVQNQINYFSETHFNEIVTIESQLVNFSDKTAIIEIIMYNEDKSKIKAVLWCTVVYFNLMTRKSESHPEYISEMFSKVLIPPTAKTFEERIKELKTPT